MATKKEEPLKAEVSPKPAPKTLTNKISPPAASLGIKKETAAEKRERLMEKLRRGGA